MNPFEVLAIVISGALLSALTIYFFNESTFFGSELVNELTLKSIIEVSERGSLLDSFNATIRFKESLIVTPESLTIGSASVSNPGFNSIQCDNQVIVSEWGLSC